MPRKQFLSRYLAHPLERKPFQVNEEVHRRRWDYEAVVGQR